MEISEIKELLGMIQASGIEEFEMEKAGVRVKIRNSRPFRNEGSVTLGPTTPSQPVAAAAQPIQEALPAAKAEDDKLYTFKAPIVGTFYLTPKPDADPFVQVGDRITKNTVLCIIEAMKIFNQIESDIAGEIVAILVQNGQPVEFGEPLFKIRPN